MKLNYRRTFFIGLAFLSICAFWQTYDNIIPLMLQNTFGLGETVTGVLMAMDNVLAIFLLPVFGTLSDKVNTKLGKRTPFILVGTILAVVFYMLLAAADTSANILLFIVALFCTLIAMGLYRSPAVALMPDLTPNALRSKANAVINLMGAVGGVYALIMIKLLVKESNETLSFADGTAGRMNYTPLFVSVAGLMVVAIAILLLTIHENSLKKKVAAEVATYEKENHLEQAESEVYNGDDEGTAKEEKVPMSADVKRSMIFLLLSIFLWYTAYNAVTTAFSRYVGVVWGMTDGGFANCLMVATVAAIVSYIPIGLISGRIGRKKTILIGVVVMTICYAAAIFATSYTAMINVAFAFIGFGWAAINVNSYPMIVEMSKGSDIGKFTGTYYTFSMAAQIFTPIFSGFLLEHVSYRTLFPYAVIFSVLAFFTMLQVHHGDVKPAKKASVLENFDVDD